MSLYHFMSEYLHNFRFFALIILENYEQINQRKRGIDHVLHPRMIDRATQADFRRENRRNAPDRNTNGSGTTI